MSKERLRFPATARNRDPIFDVLLSILPPRARVLELGSGSGEHAIYFAERLNGVTWIATDIDPQALASIRAWARYEGTHNVEIVEVDAGAPPWPVSGPVDAVISINLIHIAPWEVCQGLLRGTGDLLRPGDILYLYGPFKRGGRHTAKSNEEFDASLRARDPRWGVRDLDEVVALAEQHELALEEVVPMPANNHSVIFRKVQPQ